MLGALVFKDGTALKKLNTFSHPKIMRRLNELMDKDCSKLVFAEVPLFFEEGYEKEFDYVIVVLRNREARIAATMTRDGLSAEEVTKRIEAQFNYEYLNDNPKYFRLYNDGSFDKLQTNISKILENIMKQ